MVKKSGIVLRCGAALIAAAGMAGQAEAVLLDFEDIPAVNVTAAGDQVPVAMSVVTDQYKPQGVVFGLAGVSTGVAGMEAGSLAPSSGTQSIAGLDDAGLIPGSQFGAHIGDIFFSFVVPGTMTPGKTDMVDFTIGDGGGDNDIFQIRAYSLSNALIHTADVSGISRFAVSINTPGIHRVEVDFTGDFGYTLDDLQFSDPYACVPEPVTAGLGLIGLGALAGATRRRKV